MRSRAATHRFYQAIGHCGARSEALPPRRNLPSWTAWTSACWCCASFGLMLVSHGYNKFFGPNGLHAHRSLVRSMGVRPGRLNATVAATTEVGGPALRRRPAHTLAAAGMIGLMTVAIVVAHWRVGWFIFRKGEGMEYCLMIAVAAFSVT